MKTKQSILQKIGPGFITAAIVIGPGSIVASSRAGAQSEYRLIWVLLGACFLMAAYTAMGARLGCALSKTPLHYVAERWGRPWAAITGLSAFLVCAGFQFGNNIGVAVALREITGTPAWIWPILFTAVALFFLATSKQLYKHLERIMMALVATMMLAFLINLFWTGIRPISLAKGLVPSKLAGDEALIGAAMLATTFSVVAAFYQAYLVQEKGWKKEDIGLAIRDAWLGIAIMGSIAIVILMGAAGALYGNEGNFSNVGQLAEQLRGVLGSWATLIFCLGISAASFSSFIANALLGGSMMADGLGQSAAIKTLPARLWSVSIMLIGCGVAVMVFLLGEGSTTSLLIAQSSTLIAAPVCAALILGMTSSKRIMGDLQNRWPSCLVGGIGMLVILGLFLRTLLKLLGQLGLMGG